MVDLDGDKGFGPCSCCGYVGDVTLYDQERPLCEVCASTYLSGESEFDNVARSMGWLYNALLDTLDVREKFLEVCRIQDEREFNLGPDHTEV